VEIPREEQSTVNMPSPFNSGRHLIEVGRNASDRELTKAREKEIEQLNLLLNMVDNIGREPNLKNLVSMIVKRTSQIMDCARTSIFLLDKSTDELYSLVAEGLQTKEIRFPSSAGLAGYVARTGWKINVPDAYQDERFNPQLDLKTGFRTNSVLAMPLFDNSGEVMGVVQCLNRKDADGHSISFEADDEPFLSALSSLFSVFLENAKSYRQMTQLLASMVSAFTRSIDDRDPCTHGHSKRVTLYALNLAQAVHHSDQPPFDRVCYTYERFRQLRYAGLLHDVGKIGVREYILCKSDKLPEGGLILIEHRLDLIREKRRAHLLEQALNEKSDHRQLLETEWEPLSSEVEAALELLRATNQPSFVSDEKLAGLKALLDKQWITATEYKFLSVRKGNLTDSEWEDMKSHAQKSFELLIRIAWPQDLKGLADIAHTHHEKLDGSGYPRGLTAKDIPFDGKVLTVADIYDALTASDRPYKKAMPHEKAMQILVEEEAGQGKLVPELVDLFFSNECYKIDENLLEELT